MKRLVLIITVFLCSITETVYSQLNKGNILLGGSVNFGVGNIKNENDYKGRTRYFHISPNAGIALSKKIVMGCFMQYSFYRTVDDPNNYPIQGIYTNNQHRLSVPYFYAQYYKKIAGSFYFVPEARIGEFLVYDMITSKSTIPVSTTKTKYILGGIDFRLVPRITYFINHRLMLTAAYGSIGFSSHHGRVESETSGVTTTGKLNRTSFNFNFSPQSLNIGIFFILNNKKTTANSASTSSS
jgi:hypothetical protein